MPPPPPRPSETAAAASQAAPGRASGIERGKRAKEEEGVPGSRNSPAASSVAASPDFDVRAPLAPGMQERIFFFPRTGETERGGGGGGGAFELLPSSSEEDDDDADAGEGDELSAPLARSHVPLALNR